MKLWMKVLIGLLLGILTGLIVGPQAEYLKPIGSLFLSLISMLIVLLVFSSMTVGITSIHDPQKLGRVGIKTLLLYLGTTAVAISFGLFFAYVIQPGIAMKLSGGTSVVIQETPRLGEMLLSLIPSNPVASFAQGNILQVIVFSIFLGIALHFSGEHGKPLLKVLESLSEVMYRMTSIVMEFAPIGVFAIMAWIAGSFGIHVLFPLAKFLMAYSLACAVHILVVFCGLLWFMAKLSPKPFFKGMGDAIMVAFSTSSSSATLPVSMHCVQENLGVSKSISSFVLPLGSTVNMNGTAIFQGMSTLFIAQAYGIHLDIQSVLTIVVTATLSAVGAAGIPGSGFIMLSVVFSAVGLPIEGLAILAGIDRMRDMIGTVLNILGDAVCAVLIAQQEGELDERQYHEAELVQLEEAID